MHSTTTTRLCLGTGSSDQAPTASAPPRPTARYGDGHPSDRSEKILCSVSQGRQPASSSLCRIATASTLAYRSLCAFGVCSRKAGGLSPQGRLEAREALTPALTQRGLRRSDPGGA